ncbi:MAG: RES family NAD+ phosphorylase [Ferruginibacter sp.]|nr:RES family NAD+ phosphorylase [Ferruginibacter sp.]
MIVYRITTDQWSKSLTASGYAARWSAKGYFVIYTAESRSLAWLENLVHRSGEGNNNLYKVMLIDIPDTIPIENTDAFCLKKDWHTTDNYGYCQSIGSKWLNELKSAVLKVPSIVIKKEHNYLINPHHPDFKKITLTGNEDFDFDRRF